MPTFLYDDLTQRLARILEQRYESLLFENGSLIPTLFDLVPGARELVFDSITEYGDADLWTMESTNIPIVDISIAEDRYAIYAVASGFPITFQEERAYNSNLARRRINRFDRRMSAARKVIAMRVDRFTAFGRSPLAMRGFVNNTAVPIVNATDIGGAANVAIATYNQLCDFFVAQIETITDNFVSSEPTTMLVSSMVNRQLGKQNPNGTKSVRQFLKEEYPNLEIIKTKQLSNAELLAGGLTVGTVNANQVPANSDRIILYPKDGNVVHRHLEQRVAELVPPDYIRVDGMRKIYTMFQCFTPVVIDYTYDVRYVNVPVS